MKVKINGKAEELRSALNIAELLALKGLLPERIVVEHNDRIVPKDEFTAVEVSENDRLEIVTFVGGG
jgi:sulfur carrier protein